MMTETAFKSLCINMVIFTSTKILGMVSLLFLLTSSGFFIIGYLANNISRSIENIIQELAEDENYINYKYNIRYTMEELITQIHSCVNSLYSLSDKVDYSTVKIKKEKLDESDTDDEMPSLVEITQNDLSPDFEKEDMNDDTSSELAGENLIDQTTELNNVTHSYNLRGTKVSNKYENFSRSPLTIEIIQSENYENDMDETQSDIERDAFFNNEKEASESEEEHEESSEAEEEHEESSEADEEEEEADEEVVILEVEKKKNDIINLIESDDEEEA